MKNKKKLQIIVSTSIITTFIFLFFAPDIFAANGITLPSGTGLPDKSINAVLTNVLNWFLGFLAALAILMIIISGIMYVTSGGDDSRVETAKKILTYAIIGLVVALLSYVIVIAISTML